MIYSLIRCLDKNGETLHQSEIEQLRHELRLFPKASYMAIETILGVLYGST